MLIDAVDAPAPARVDVPLHAVASDRDGPRVRAEVVDQVPERVADCAEPAPVLDRVVRE